jgi:hypothetical protein
MVLVAIMFAGLIALGAWLGPVGIGGLAVSLVLLAVYFLPTMVARGNQKRNTGAVFLLNLLLGWTLLGWIAALIWAASKDAPTTVVAA